MKKSNLKLFYILFGILIYYSSFSQDSTTIKIKLVDYEVDFFPGNCDSFYVFKLPRGEKLFVKLLGCSGEMDVVHKSANNLTIDSGHYCGSLDTLKAYRVAYNASSQETRMAVITYFQPLRDGSWTFYVNKKAIKKMYSQGILKKK